MAFQTYFKRGSKYGAVKSTFQGNHYDSKMEMSYAMELELRCKAKEIKSWERQIRFPLVVNSYKITTYIIDFKVIHANKKEEFIETKGMWTDVAVQKVKLFMALYPDLWYTIIGDTKPVHKMYMARKNKGK